MNQENEFLLVELEKLLKGGGAHVGFDDAIAGIPENLLGERFQQLPYSIWQLIEHIRIAQADMLDFCRNPNYKELNWPDEYWPKDPVPKSIEEFEASIQSIHADLDEFIELMYKGGVYKTIPNGQGQTLLREALQIADHTAYHVAEIVVIRRLLNIWKVE